MSDLHERPSYEDVVAALALAYPYVKDVYDDTSQRALRDLIEEDLAFIGPTLREARAAIDGDRSKAREDLQS